MQTRYSKTFKIQAVKKALSRRSGISLSSIARSLDVKITTLHGWVKAMENKELIDLPPRGETIEKSPNNWTANERFEAIIETSKLTQEELSEYCRKKGLFLHHLAAWKAGFIDSYGPKNKDKNKQVKELRNQNRILAVELRRKEKALAEAAALLILKKKVHILWRSEEEG